MIREINELILLLDKNETGFTLYRVFGKSGTVDIADRKKDQTNKDIENEDLYIKRECDKINKIAPYCFSEKLHLPEKLQNEYDEIDIDKTIYHEFAGEFANSIKLPDGVMQIGNNAFYNCKKLESITIGKNIKEVGSDVFMNCRSLNKIYLRSDISDITGLKQVLSRISSEIEVTYIKEEKVIAKVLYPEYSEVYDEIAPAHIFGRNIEGEGFRARQCFDGGKADMNQYDTIFPKASAEESVKVAGKIALYRVMYPYMLGSSSEVLYMDYLKNTVTRIVESICNALDEVKYQYENLHTELCRDITFITSQELEDLYPNLTPKERENAFVKEKKTVFIMQIGDLLKSGERHDGRAPDYDDWKLNGDLLFWHEPLQCALEVSSMGIRVDAKTLDEQLTKAGCDERRNLTFHKMLLNNELPLTIGGGIGQSRICMLLLQKAHVGEVQASIWDEHTLEACEKAGIEIL